MWVHAWRVGSRRRGDPRRRHGGLGESGQGGDRDASPTFLEGEDLLLGEAQGLGELHLSEGALLAEGGDPLAELLEEGRFLWTHRWSVSRRLVHSVPLNLRIGVDITPYRSIMKLSRPQCPEGDRGDSGRDSSRITRLRARLRAIRRRVSPRFVCLISSRCGVTPARRTSPADSRCGLCVGGMRRSIRASSSQQGARSTRTTNERAFVDRVPCRSMLRPAYARPGVGGDGGGCTRRGFGQGRWR